jgi:hypothetical protein
MEISLEATSRHRREWFRAPTHRSRVLSPPRALSTTERTVQLPPGLMSTHLSRMLGRSRVLCGQCRIPLQVDLHMTSTLVHQIVLTPENEAGANRVKAATPLAIRVAAINRSQGHWASLAEKSTVILASLAEFLQSPLRSTAGFYHVRF